MGMNVAFSSPQADYNPSYWITGSWYNSELGNYPQYGVANLPVGDGYVVSSDVSISSNLVQYELQ